MANISFISHQLRVVKY